MALSSEHILTLQQLSGIGTKTIFKIAEQVIKPIHTIEELCTVLLKRKCNLTWVALIVRNTHTMLISSRELMLYYLTMSLHVVGQCTR